MMGFRCPTREHIRKGIMVEMLRDGILKLNDLLPDELLKWRKTCMGWGW
jgi:hypothetical protein